MVSFSRTFITEHRRPPTVRYVSTLRKGYNSPCTCISIQPARYCTVRYAFLHDFFLHATTSASIAASPSRAYANNHWLRLCIGSYHLFPVGVLPNVFKVVKLRLEYVFVDPYNKIMKMFSSLSSTTLKMYPSVGDTLGTERNNRTGAPSHNCTSTLSFLIASSSLHDHCSSLDLRRKTIASESKIVSTSHPLVQCPVPRPHTLLSSFG
jgi:hypothetical protein